MNKNEIINEILDILLQLKPDFQKYIGKNRIAATLKDKIKLRSNQQMCLNIIHSSNDGVSMSSLASSLGVSNQQATRIVDDLEGYNFVMRKKDETNKRVVLVYITNTGEEYFKDIFKSLHTLGIKIFSELENDVLDKLYYHLKEIQNIMRQIG